jgi:two-component system sensor histidine kinase GlrK
MVPNRLWVVGLMRIPRVSSFLQYALLATAAILLPPSAALVTATLSLDELAETGSQTVLDAATTVELARKLVEHANQMERFARQRRTLADERYADLYLGRRDEFVDTELRLLDMPLDPETWARLVALRTEEAAVYAVLVSTPPESQPYGEALERFGELATDARGILTASSHAIGRAATAMREDARALERRLLIEAAWVVPLVLGVLAFALVAIVRPLRAVDDAIRLLGSGELERTVSIRGPHDLRELGARLEWLRQRLLEVESDRTRLLRHVSHELKTPLTCIREGTQLLEDGITGTLTSEQKEITRIIFTNATELGRRIEDLLRASELQHAGVTLDPRPVELHQVVRQVVDQNHVAARARRIHIACVLEPLTIIGDAQKLKTVVDNLVTNGIKFSPDGGTLRVELASLEGGGARIVVEDEGPGVDPTEREAVFEAFYQGRATWMRQVGGTGLGLAIAREYARAHGGDVHIEDGTTGARVVVRLGTPRGGSR